MKYGYTIIYVDDVPSTIGFYNRAFGIETKFLHESKQYAELSTGSTALAFASHELGRMNVPTGYLETDKLNKPFGYEIGLITDDVESAYNRAVKEGARSVAEPSEKPWGQIVAYVRSIEGTLIEICSPMADKA